MSVKCIVILGILHLSFLYLLLTTWGCGTMVLVGYVVSLCSL